ncbi:Guanine nucleotide-binding protein alpha-2 subunit [Didymella heteroderae]|uniref:Guanine nucleotide-binding protein alpha-2 subunit n=1 Tax=Didymella heteroderae TaxID=1769908 RepID=A0A9P4X1X4_9PLEO|nr:Guanine nucleotide-binding protein alpha-2 subunit [Didymella heteroderae]
METRLEKPYNLCHEEETEFSVEPQSCTALPNDTEGEERSKAIERVLEEDAKMRKNQAKVLPLGAFSMRDVVKQLRNNDTDDAGLTEDELIEYRYNVHQTVFTCVRALLDVADASEVRLDENVDSRYKQLRDYVSVAGDDMTLNEEAGQAIESLWQEPSIMGAFRSSVESDLKETSAYFFQDISRIAASKYIPTETDVLQSRKGTRSVSEHRFHVKGLTIHIIDVGFQRGERRKWIRQFDSIAAVLFVADLARYDDMVSSGSALAEQMELFDSVVNTSIWAPDTKIILFLNNVSAFRRKLSCVPLGGVFPGFHGGDDAEQAVEYLLQRFRDVNRGRRRVFEYVVDPHVAGNIELVAAAING